MTVSEREVGWYPDPRGRADERWWDGEYWSSTVRGALDGIVTAREEVETEEPDAVPRSESLRSATLGTASVLVAFASVTAALLSLGSLVAVGLALVALVTAAVSLVARAWPSAAVLAIVVSASAVWVALATERQG